MQNVNLVAGVLKITSYLIAFAAYALLNQASCDESSNDGGQPAERLVEFATGLETPVGIINSGDSRLFVINQRGSIIIIDSTGDIAENPFFQIADIVEFGGERGLLGLAFPPDFDNNGYFYVNYIGKGDSTHISRFKTFDDNPDMGDPASELKLISLKQPYPNHNGGHIAFGPDGYLYIGLGDGGSQGDPQNRAQNPKTFLGKILRIDVDQGEPYSIPSSNPHFNDTSWLGEIWALGFRNPWRFSFDRLTHELWIADVGQDHFEEINLQSAASTGGENYGWRCYEGDSIFNADLCLGTEFVAPVHAYAHNPECSVIGGYAYRGNKSSPFYGKYFFADYCSDKIWTLANNGGTWTAEDFGEFRGNSFSAFGEDYKGELYIAGHESGKLYKIVTK